MSEGFPLLTTKKMPIKTIATELIWFLKGDTNIQYLVKNNCNIWNGDAYKAFLKNSVPHDHQETMSEFVEKIKTDDEFAKQWGELGPIYGKQWREWKGKTTTDYDERDKCSYDTTEYIDQIKVLVDTLKTNPDSRRLLVNAWNVGELNQMTLPPCHYGFECWTRELSIDERKDIFKKEHDRTIEDWDAEVESNTTYSQDLDAANVPERMLSLRWIQRSVDTFLGLPFNIASYGILLEILAKEVNMIPGELIGSLGDTHLYTDHIEQAKEQIGRELKPRKRTLLAKEMGVELPNGMKSSSEWDKICDTHDVPNRTREPFPLPKLNLTEYEGQTFGIFNDMYVDNFQLEGYQSHPHIKANLSN